MRLPGRMAAAIEVLADIEARKRPASEALKAWALDHRFAGAGDRAAIGNIVYDALRRRASHAFRMDGDAPRALVLSVLVNDWGESVEALNQNFIGDRFAPDSLSEEEAARLCDDSWISRAPDWVRADVPEWVAPSLARALGDDWITEGQGLAQRPPLDMRANTLKANRDKVAAALKRFAPQPCAIAPDGLRIAAGPRDARTANVQADAAFQKGWFEIQDEGSQVVAALSGAGPGEQVLDLCAGGGGKTLALSAAMANTGQVFAFDADRNRLAPIFERLKRAGARNVQVCSPDAGALDDLVGAMDRVVVDAPCTGTGTWRRRPDAKWKLTPAQLAARQAEQRAVLEDAQRYIKPGGTLVYITCSLLSEENAEQVEAFLGTHAGFELMSAGEAFADRFPDAGRGPLDRSAQTVTLTPHTSGTDGFYCALMRRIG